MNDEQVVITKLRKGRPKKPSALEKGPQEVGPDGSGASPQGEKGAFLEGDARFGIRPSSDPLVLPGNGGPSTPHNPDVSALASALAPVGSAPPKTRKKSAKALAKEELIEAEKQLKKAQLEQEQEMRKKALEEIAKLEALKAQLLREEIQKQIEAEAKGEVKRTRKTQAATTAEGEKKKTNKKLVKNLMPEPAPVLPPAGSALPPTPVSTPALAPAPVPIPLPAGLSSAPLRSANLFSQRGGRPYF